MTQTNRKPPDELADVREKIKVLGVREEELKKAILAGEVELLGDEFVAVITTTTSERIDSKKLRKDIPAEQLAPFLVSSTSTSVRLERMTAVEE